MQHMNLSLGKMSSFQAIRDICMQKQSIGLIQQ